MSASPFSSESGPKFRVAICGAGIAGLILAITIGKYDPHIPIDLYEAHDSIETAGVGILMWKRTHEILIELGLFDDFKHIFTHNPNGGRGTNARRADIREGGYPWYIKVNRYDPSTMHRQQMVAILEKHLPASCTLHSGKRLVSYLESKQQDVPIKLEFRDGSTATTDVLVGADGIRSAVRKILFEAASENRNSGDDIDLKQYGEATFTGISIYRCLIPAETLRRESPENQSLSEMVAYHGKGRHIFTYPIAKGTIINVAAFVCDQSLKDTRYEGNWVSEVTRDELVECFDNFEPNVKIIAKLCEKPSKWALHVVKPLPFCIQNRVALIGDAAHAMTPHFGAGAGQGIEDGFILGRLLAHPLTAMSRIPDIFRIYEEIRLPVARDIASLSLSCGWLYSFMEPGYYDGTRKEEDLDDKGVSAYERDGMETIKQETLRRWDWYFGLSGGLQAWEEAESKLEASVN